MKKYKPKKWFIYTRIIAVFICIFFFSRTTNEVYKEITVNNEGYVRFVADRGADYIFIPVTDENLASADTFTELLRN